MTNIDIKIKPLIDKLLLSDEVNAPKILNIDNVLDLFNVGQRNLFLVNNVVEEDANGINSLIRFWNAYDEEVGLPIEEREPIKLYINNYGGSLVAGYSIIDSILLSKTPVWTINIAAAYSAAFEIFIVGHKRIAYPLSSFLCHEGSAGMVGDANKFRNYADFYGVQLDQAKQNILAHTKITKEEYEKHQKDDWWFTAEEAIKYGICDEIAEVLV